jgi:hypothetical protein
MGEYIMANSLTLLLFLDTSDFSKNFETKWEQNTQILPISLHPNHDDMCNGFDKVENRADYAGMNVLCFLSF